VAAWVPWLTYTHNLNGQPLYWGSSSGLSPFWMSPTRPGETGQWHEQADVFHDSALAAGAASVTVARTCSVSCSRSVRPCSISTDPITSPPTSDGTQVEFPGTPPQISQVCSRSRPGLAW